MRFGVGLFRAVVAFGFILGGAGQVTAADRPHVHDGFYLRLAGGLGYGIASASKDGVDAELKGLGASSTIGIGFALNPDIILNADVTFFKMFDPKGKLAGYSDDLNGDATIWGLGAGVTHYFMPYNIYVSGSFGLAKGSVDIEGTSGDSDLGWGLNAVVGKEWWVNEAWGVGVAGQVYYTSVDASIYGYDVTIGTIVVGVLCSATFN